MATKKTAKKKLAERNAASRERAEHGSITAPTSGAREVAGVLNKVDDLRKELSEEEVSEAASVREMHATKALAEEHHEPEPLAHDVSMLVDHTGAHEIVPGAQPVDHDVTLTRLAVRRDRAARVQAQMTRGPNHRNVVRPPAEARNDLIAADLATTDEFRVAASEAAQMDVLDDLHVRRVDKLTDDQVANLRVATRAARQVRAENIARLEKVSRRRDALVEAKSRLLAEGDSLSVVEPDYVTRARHRAESQEQAENQRVDRTVASTPEPYHERRRLAP